MSLPGKERILVVDDSPATVEVLERNLANRGHPVLAVSSVAEAIVALDSSPIDLVITDLKMPGGNGLDLVRHVRERYPAAEVMMITGYATVENAVQAMKGGAEEYLAKPFTAEELNAAVERVLGKLRSGRSAGDSPSAILGLAGRSAAMARIRDQVFRAAHSTNPVLVLGEPGTGRQLVARAIHYASPRAEGAFVPVACGRIPAHRFEREVLGASGLLAAAGRGTLFLADVHLLDPDSQGRLARALTEVRECRVMASGPTDLAARGTAGRFRPELLARLEATRIDVPALRDRREDVAPLAEHFLARAVAPGAGAPAVDAEAQAFLEQHDWPGNVAELEAVLRRFEGTRLTATDLPLHLRPGMATAPAAPRTLAEWELEHIRQVLETVGGNKTRAAAILGIDRKTLRQKLR